MHDEAEHPTPVREDAPGDEVGRRRLAPLPPSPDLRALHVLLLGGLSSLLALVMKWPLPLELGRSAPQDPGDPMLIAWQVAWSGHALVHQPLHWFDANTFWPIRSSLAFSDSFLGFAPIAWFGSGPHAALVRLNLLFLLAYALAFFATALLARELGARWSAAVLAGAAFAYSPWRLYQDVHLQIVSSGAIPLALFLLIRGYRRGRARLVVAGYLVALWQVSLTFSLGIQLLYLLVLLGVLVGAAWLWSGRPRPTRRMTVATAVGAGLLLAGSGGLALVYQQLQDAQPVLVRRLIEVNYYSPPFRGYLSAPDFARFWGHRTGVIRNTLPNFTEQALFPGLVTMLLAVAGAGIGRRRPLWPRWLRLTLVGLVLLTGVLALGTSMGPRSPYHLLRHLPGWIGVRTPGRLHTLTTLGLALLAAAGATALTRYRAAGGRVICVGLTVLVLIEGWGRLALPEVPMPPPQVTLGSQPQLHLPSGEIVDRTHMFWSTQGFPLEVNGGGITPPSLAQLREAVAGFPDFASVDLLRRLGVRTVVVHRELAPNTPWAGAADKPAEGLPLVRTDRGRLVQFDLDPLPVSP